MLSHVSRALIFIADTLISLYAIVVLLRVLLQIVHANFYNPLSQFVWQATRVPVRWIGQVVPRRGALDIPAIVFALLLCYVDIEIILALSAQMRGVALDYAQLRPAAAIAWAVFKAAVLVCNLYTFTILIQALMSWIAPQQQSPATALMNTLNEPLLAPVRRSLPAFGGLDLSPLVVIIVLQAISILVPLPGALH